MPSSLFATGTPWFAGSAAVAGVLLSWWLGVVLLSLRTRGAATGAEDGS